MLFRRIFYSKYRLNNFSTKLNEIPNSYSNLDSKLANIAQSIKVTESCYNVNIFYF